MKLAALILIITLPTGCAAMRERREIRRALKVHYDSQHQFERLYAPEIKEFNRFVKK